MKKNKSKFTLRLIIGVILVGIIIANLLITILPIKERYVEKNYWGKYQSLKNAYNSSVYQDKKGSFIPDEIIYAYAGGAYIKGVSPILINPETPPLGKYLIGLSILLFNNENVIILIAGIVSLLFLFLIGTQVLSSKVAALLPPFFLSFEPLFKNQFVYTPLLDIIHLTFMLGAFYFFIKAINATKNILLYFLLANLFLGFYLSTKFFGVGIAIIGAWYVYILVSKNKKLFMCLTATLPISILVLLFSYILVFFTNYPPSQFLGIQKWVFLYNKGHLQHPFSVWSLLLFNKWQTWWGTNAILSDKQWSFIWPTIVVISFFTTLFYILGKIPKKRGIEAIMAWVVFYLALLSLSDSSVRYFVILLPLLYVIAIFGLENLVINYFLKKKNMLKKIRL